MLSKSDFVMKVFGEIESGYIKEAGARLSDNFLFAGATPEPLNKNQFLDLFQSLVAALPDLSFNMGDFREQGDFVHCNIRMTGTNTEKIDIPLLGVHEVPATRRSVRMPEESAEVTVIDNKITRIKFQAIIDGGVAGLLGQLGIELPAPVLR